VRRAVATVLGALLLALLGLLAGAGPASAHAQLEQTTPAQGSEVEVLPPAVSLSFGESVTVNGRSMEVLDGSGGRVDTGVVSHPGGRGSEVTVGVRGGLPKGSYTVVWKVVSADSHPVSGTFTFGYGVAAGVASAGTDGSPLVTVLDGVGRGIAYAGVALLVGGAAFLWGLWPAGGLQRRPRQLLLGGWITTLVSTVLLFFLAGPYQNGLGLGAVTEGDLIAEVASTRYGKLLLARVLLLALAVPVLRRLLAAQQPAGPRAVERDRGQALDLAGLGITVLATFSLSEHAGTGTQVPLSAATDLAHLAASSVWVGGLVLLAASLLRAEHAAELRAVLPRWSRWAMVSVAVIAGTGGYQSWREVGTFPAFTSTGYGVLLLAKIGGFLLLLALGDLGRRWVLRHAGTGRAVAVAASSLADAPAAVRSPPPPTPLQVRALRRSVGIEVLVAAAVLALTAVLVNSLPARDAYSAPFDTTVTALGTSGQSIAVTVDVTSTRRGLTTVHAYTYDSVGRVQPVTRVDLLLTDKAGRFPPVRQPFTAAGEGHGTAYDVVVPAPGLWTMTLQVTVGATDGYAAAFDYRVT